MSIHSVYDNPACLALFPPLDGEQGSRILELAFLLHSEATAFRQSLPDEVVAGIADTVRIMNCYYSNLIEGHDTRPLDIERAMRREFSPDKQKRDLQHEALAHVSVQRLIDEGSYDDLSLVDVVCRMHRDFYDRMPPAFRVVKSADGTLEVPVEPGQYRTDAVEVGEHVAVDAGVIPAFMSHLSKGYDVRRLRSHERPVAAAALHHRFLWVHPFADGNGRVGRLLSHAYLRQAGLGCGLWSVARGLAIFNKRYKAGLARADYPPQGATDGRGPLSDSGLAGFVHFFLAACLDQVRFMRQLLEPEALKRNLASYVAARAVHGEMDQRVIPVLQYAASSGTVERQAAYGLMGISDRQGRRLLEPLFKDGLLVDPGGRAPYRIAFPLLKSIEIFPRLFSRDAMHEASLGVVGPDEEWHRDLDTDADVALVQDETPEDREPQEDNDAARLSAP